MDFEQLRRDKYPPGVSNLEIALTEALRVVEAERDRLREALADGVTTFADTEWAKTYWSLAFPEGAGRPGRDGRDDG